MKPLCCVIHKYGTLFATSSRTFISKTIIPRSGRDLGILLDHSFPQRQTTTAALLKYEDKKLSRNSTCRFLLLCWNPVELGHCGAQVSL